MKIGAALVVLRIVERLRSYNRVPLNNMNSLCRYRYTFNYTVLAPGSVCKILRD